MSSKSAKSVKIVELHATRKKRKGTAFKKAMAACEAMSGGKGKGKTWPTIKPKLPHMLKLAGFPKGKGAANEHSRLFIAAISEIAAATNNPGFITEMATAVDPLMTSTPGGHIVMEAARKVATSEVGPSLVDVTMDDSATAHFYFESVANISESQVLRQMTDFGKTDVICRPGDAITESLKSEFLIVSLTVDPSKADAVDEDVEFDADGNPKGVSVLNDADHKTYSAATAACLA